MEMISESIEYNDDKHEIEYRWFRWIFENLVGGCSVESMEHTILSSTTKNKMEVISEVRRAARNPYLRAAKEMKHALRKRNWLLETCDHLSSLDRRYSTSIEKREAPEFPEFVKEYYSKNLPVVLTRGVDHWPARIRWTPEYFSERVGDKLVEVQLGREKDPHYERHSLRHKKKMRMDKFCRLVTSGGISNDYYLTANNNQESLSNLSPLFEDVGDFGGGYRTKNTIKYRSHLWFGPEGAFTPLHHDLTNNMLVQIYGKKRLTLIPAFQVDSLYNDKHVYSATSFPVVDKGRFPKMESVTPVEVVLNPGDAAFIPIGWWHCVDSLDVSISVSFTDFNVKNDFSKRFPRL